VSGPARRGADKHAFRGPTARAAAPEARRPSPPPRPAPPTRPPPEEALALQYLVGRQRVLARGEREAADAERLAWRAGAQQVGKVLLLELLFLGGEGGVACPVSAAGAAAAGANPMLRPRHTAPPPAAPPAPAPTPTAKSSSSATVMSDVGSMSSPGHWYFTLTAVLNFSVSLYRKSA
jgi:hypothetical protein